MSMISEKLRKARQGVKEEDSPAAQALRLAAYGAASGRLREQEEQEAQGLQSLRLAAYGAAQDAALANARRPAPSYAGTLRAVPDSGTGTSAAKQAAQQEYEAGKERARYLDFATGAELQRRLREAEDALSLSGGGRAEDAAARAAKAELDKWQSDVRAARGQETFGEHALNLLGDAAAGFMRGVGNPVEAMARLMELPEDALYWITGDERFNQDSPDRLEGRASKALTQSSEDTFALSKPAEERPMLERALVQTAQAAGNMLSAGAIYGQAFGAANTAGLEAAANATPALGASLASRTANAVTSAGARAGLEILRNPGNFGISLGSGVNAYSEAIGNGADFGQAVTNGFAKGLAEYFSNKLFSGTPFENNPAEKGYVTRLTEHIAQKLGKSEALAAFNTHTGGKVFNWFMDKTGEGMEEVVTAIADPLIDRLTYDEDADFATADELVEEFLGGILLSLAMSPAETLADNVERHRVGANLLTGETVGQIGDVAVPGVDAAAAALIESGLESPEGTESRTLAEAALEKAQAGRKVNALDMGRMAAANAAQVASEEAAEERSFADAQDDNAGQENGRTADAEERGRQIVTEGNPRSGAAPTEENEAARAAANVVMTAEDRVNAQIDAEERSLEAMERTAAGMGLGENGAAYLRASYRGGDTAAHLRDYVRAYNAGVTGEELGTATGTQQIAWNAGRMDAAQSVRDNGKAVVSKKPGLVRDASFKAANISAEQERALDVLGRVTGSEIRFGRLSEDENARYDARSATITVNVNAKDPVMAAATHEIVHRIRDVSPEAYKTLRQFVVDNMSDRALAVSTKVTGKVYNTNDVGYITEEMVANAFGRMAENNALLDQFVREHRTAAQRVLDALRDLIDRVRTALRRGPTQRSLTAAQNREFEDLLGRLEEAQRTMEAALDTAEEIAGRIEAGASPQMAEESGMKQSRVTDAELLRELESGETVTVYRAMQLIDGKLYPPMAAKVKGGDGRTQFVEPTEINVWYQSDERPDLVKNGKFTLNKGNGSSIAAAYNPYFHTSASPLNDQFSSAYNRPNLVVVEGVIPKSELTSGYKAEGAKDSVGETKWHAGPVASKLKGDKARRVFLSRWFMAQRIVPDAEVAQVVANTLRGEDVAVPTNVVTPSLLAELRKQGVKIEEAPGNGGGVKFSLKAPIEETKDLLAVHGMTAENLRGALRLGGLPMPSIAVVKAEAGHNRYGEISLVFDKSTIDPEADRRNKVYGADAWTPTAPRVDYELDYDGVLKLEDRIEELSRSVADGIFGNSSILRSAGVDDSTSIGVDELAEKLGGTDAVKAAYLAERGETLEPVKKAKVWGKYGNESLQRLIDQIGPQRLAQINSDLWAGMSTSEALGPEEETIRQIIRDYYIDEDEAILQKRAQRNGWTEEQTSAKREAHADSMMENNVSLFTLEDFARNAWAMYEDGGATRGENDYYATQATLRKAVSDKTATEWIRPQIEALYGQPWLYNGKDPYTASGNRRSFRQLHDAYTLENIVKAMSTQQNQRGEGIWLAGAHGLQATATPSYRNIAEIKADSGRLGTVSEEDLKRLSDAVNDEFDEVVTEIVGTGGYQEREIAGEVLMMAAQGSKTVAAIRNTFARESEYKISEATAKKIQQLYKDAAALPTEYFEAKPQRAVGFDEVLAAVVPTDLDADLKQGLRDAGVQNVLEYELFNNADRTAKLNSVEGVKFSLKEDSEGRELTEAQAAYFADSKAVDEDGRLLVLYHGTTAYGEINKFRRGRSGWLGPGIYLTSRKADAQRYADAMGEGNGSLYELFANVKQPLVVTGSNPVPEILMAAYGRESVYKARSAKQSNDPQIITPADIKKLQAKGYDGIRWDFGRSTEISVFSPEQIKRTDNLSPTGDPDIRLSRSGREILDEQIQQFGAIPEGENPVRDVPTPVKTSDRQKLSQTVRTVLEAQSTPEEMVPTIEKLTADGTYSYTQYSDKAAIQNAEDYVKNLGWAKAYGDWLRDVQRGVVNKTNTAIGWALYNNAANSGDTESALTVLDAIVKHQRAAAQAVQATRILKKLSPETQLYNVVKSVQRLQEEINQRYGEEKGPKLKVDPKLGEEFLNAGTDEQRAKVLQAIYKDIGRQMPTHFMDRWNAWRYLAMLGNPRTHVRNILGNAGFAPVVAVKDLTATAIEAAVDRVSGGKLGRTKGNLVGKGGGELLQAAWKDYAKVADQALGGGKYQDGVDADAAIQEGRIIFGNTGAAAWDRTVGRALERARRFNGTALDKEDVWFSRPHYALALAQYCKANKITPEMIAKGEGIAAARAYAIKEAQKATYRDTNQFSQAISRLGRGSGWDSNRVTRGVSTVIEGILPFRKTPANILARGVEYSPLGLLRSLTVDMIGLRNARIAAEAKAQGKKPPKFRVQPISGAEMIDHLAAGLTGTGLVMLGAWLASLGLIRGHGGDDDKRRKQDELMGHQNYALELPDGTSITLDWLAPECLPFFIGVNLWEQGQEETDGPKLADILSAVGNVTEPMLEMSCLQSLNAVFDTVGYAKEGDVNALTAALASAATSYLTQALPTLAGQGERTAEDKRYTTYADKNSFLTGDMQYTLGKASARIPGLDYGQIPYIDAWGREELTGSFLGRAFNNFINPSFTSRVDESAMEKELLRLYEATGESVLPQRAPRYFNVDKERKDLTGDEYVTYATARGRTAYTVLGSMVTSSSYKALSDANKARAVEMAYTYANQTAMTTVGGKISTSYKWVSEALEAKKKGVSPDKYILIYTTVTPIGGIPDADGKTIDNSRGLQRMEAIYNVSGLTDEQRRYLFECFDVGKTVIDYNKAKVEEELKKMRGK